MTKKQGDSFLGFGLGVNSTKMIKASSPSFALIFGGSMTRFGVSVFAARLILLARSYLDSSEERDTVFALLKGNLLHQTTDLIPYLILLREEPAASSQLIEELQSNSGIGIKELMDITGVSEDELRSAWKDVCSMEGLQGSEEQLLVFLGKIIQKISIASLEYAKICEELLQEKEGGYRILDAHSKIAYWLGLSVEQLQSSVASSTSIQEKIDSNPMESVYQLAAHIEQENSTAIKNYLSLEASI